MGLLVGFLSRAVNENEYIRHGIGIPQPDGGIMYPFKKGLVLFGEHKAKGKNTALVTESALDVIYAWGYGLAEEMDLFALMGAKMSKVHLEKLLAYREIILALDNDKGGEEGTEQIIKFLKGKVMLKKFDLFGAKDLGEVEPEDLKRLGESSKSIVESKIKSLPFKYD
mgnify:CR=1 FL=1